ncbi:MAG: DUF5702 domain-containing protein [Clostridiales bacterium]|nr:DUF5702 domain-containing protein [Clostridiales bacterium]
MKKTRNKKGSIAVFLTSILATMIIVSMVFVQAASSICGASYADAVLELAGRSVLSEFDKRLKDEYGLFAFYGLEDMVASNVKTYASASFDKAYPNESLWGGGSDDGTVDLLKLKLQSAKVNMAAYSLADVDVFEKQIEEYMEFMLLEKGIDFIKDMWKKRGGKPAGALGGDDQDEQDAKSVQSEQKALMNKVEISSLPSHGNTRNGLGIFQSLASLEKFGSVGDIFKEGATAIKVDEYIMSNFKYYIGGDKARDTFFNNEVEYILFGKMNDKSNLDNLKLDFLVMRTALNENFIHTDPELQKIIIATAETLGVAGIVLETVVTSIWALAEAENDWRLLLEGRKVPLVKTNKSWALSLKSVARFKKIKNDDGEVEGVNATAKKISKCVYPPANTGLSYEGYLRIFLFIENREYKLMRVMDLIQLNLRGSYYGDFLIKDHYTGFSLEAVVSGKKFEYEQKY